MLGAKAYGNFSVGGCECDSGDERGGATRCEDSRQNLSRHRVLVWIGFQRTEDGERRDFQHVCMTACHPTLPFGSVVRVVNLRNRKSVVVRITDRGDLGSNNGRIIDLSYGAAEKLHMTQAGLARVSVEVLSTGHPAELG